MKEALTEKQVAFDQSVEVKTLEVPQLDIDEGLTLGKGSINALTFRSFVSPQEPRPDVAYYAEDKPRGARGQYSDMQIPSFKIQSSRKSVGEEYSDKEKLTAPEKKGPKKFGPWDGVCTSCLLNIFGVIMFLRLGWVVGQAGIPLALLIIAISTVVTTLTTLSMAAISTNGVVKEGGAYFLISRSIGPNIGGAIGLLFSLGMSVAVAMYVIGFCETLTSQLEDAGFSLTGNTLNDVRVYGLVVLFINFVMAYIGTAWVIKMQIGLLALLVCAILTFIFGTEFSPKNLSEGFIGYNASLAAENLSPKYTEGYNFFSVFGVFFPAVTGIMAGANISGDLRDPSNDIPLGTMVAIVVSTIVYMGMAVMCGAVVERTGLLDNTLIMVVISLGKGTVVIAGIYAATFSSSLASLVGAPRILQRLAADGIIPFLDYFKVVRERDNAPVRGYVFSSLVAAGCILIGELNVVAPLITMFFMMTYGLINIACCALSRSKAPGWRPTYKYFTWWSALIGGILCLIIMFLTSVPYAIVSFFVGGAIYKYVQYKAVPVNWGPATEARKDKRTLKGLMNLRKHQTHIKTYRPHYLLFIGNPVERLWMVKLVATLRLGHGAVIYGNVIRTTFDKYFEIQHDADAADLSTKNTVKIHGDSKEEHGDSKEEHGAVKTTVSTHSIQELRKGYWSLQEDDKRTAGFLDTIISEDLRLGCQSLLQLGGVGRFRPNVVFMGFPGRWTNAKQEEVRGYANIIRDSFRMGMSVMIPRNFKNLDFGLPVAELSQQKGTLDVWWLADDGGLTILVSYLFILHDFWKHQVDKVKVYIVVESEKKVDNLQILMTQLISKFRLKFGTKMKWDPTPVVASPIEPQKKTVDRYNKLAATPVQNLPKSRKRGVQRWLRVSELVGEYSDQAKMIVCLMPFPRDVEKGRDYLALLEMLSDHASPTILMRGNGENCLTFQLE